MKRKNITIAALLAASIVVSLVKPAAVSAAQVQKDENVYATLQSDGSPSSVYVVNAFTAQDETTVTDYGDYSNIKNLSTEGTLSQDGDAVTLTVQDGKTYYQGQMTNAALPWNISISYTLDGRKTTAEELAGKDGHLKINITLKQNTQADRTFFKHYLLQTTVTLDTQKCKNIKTNGATEANVGNDRQLLFNVLAGQEKKLKIEADVTNFEMNAITFQGVPMQFAVDRDLIDLSGLYQKTNALKKAVSDLDDGANTLSNGALNASNASGSLQSGIDTCLSGVLNYTNGANTLASGITAYVKGTSQLSDGAKKLENLENLGSVSSAVTTLSNAVNGEGNNSLAAGSSQLSDGLKSLKTYVDQLVQMSGGEAYTELQTTVNQLYQGSVSLENGIESVGSGLNSLEDSTKNFPQAAAGIKSLNAGFEQLQKNDSSLTDGANKLKKASKKLSNGATKLSSGADTLSNGLTKLSDGAAALCDGTARFKNETCDIDAQIDDAVDNLLNTLSGDDYETVSFASAQNTNVDLVQFVIRTDAIEIPEEPEEEASQTEQTFWGKVQALFR